MKYTILNCQTCKIRELVVPEGTIALLQPFEIVIMKESCNTGS
jgi:hypothetical protein